MIKVNFLDVGQGDSIVITTPNPEVAYLVDIKDGPTVNDYMEENDINCLAAIFITHSNEKTGNKIFSSVKDRITFICQCRSIRR